MEIKNNESEFNQVLANTIKSLKKIGCFGDLIEKSEEQVISPLNEIRLEAMSNNMTLKTIVNNYEDKLNQIISDSDKFYLVNAGRMNHGKSSLLNSLIGDNIFKVQDIRETTDFLGGVRLPDTAFKAIAGTSVTTDMLFFQKHVDKGYQADDIAFSGAIRYDKDDRIWLNPYFDGEYNPQVLGSYEVRNFNGGTLSVKGNSDSLIGDVRTALEQVKPPREVDLSDIFINPDVLARQNIDTSIPSDIRETLDRYSFGYKDSTIYYRDSKGIRVGTKTEEISYYVDEEGNFQAWDTKHSQKQIDRFNDLKVTDSTALDVYVTEEATKRGQFKGY